MRLLFDHGTLVLVEPPDLRAEAIPGLMWDPRVGLWRAPAYRYGEILAALRRHGFPVRDEVVPANRPPPGPWNPIELRPYQQAAALAWEQAGRRGVVVLPTGSGKTRVATAVLAVSGKRALCLVPTRALLQQWLSELARVHGGPIGCLGDGERRVEGITVATFESAFRQMPRLGREFDLLVIDEVHHFGVGDRDEALEMSVARQRLGLTATLPENAALRRIEALVGPVVHRQSVADLAGTWLANFELVIVHLGLDPEERARYDADNRIFREVNRQFRSICPHGTWQEFVSSASQSREGRNALAAWGRCRRMLGLTRAKRDAVGTLLARHREARVLVFTADNDAAYAIARERLVMPITCDISRRERDRVLDAFRRGELRALVSSRVLNEGIDVPDADVAIVVGAAGGEREHVQRVGRLLRPVPGKHAVVYELVTAATSETRRATQRRRGLAAPHAA
ncbi:MAG TPA: DEAD/DEAH box helicase family protein [Polyangiaceae bacterium]